MYYFCFKCNAYLSGNIETYVSDKPPITFVIAPFSAWYISLYLFLYDLSISLNADFSWSVILWEFFHINLQNVTFDVCVIFHFEKYHNHCNQSFLFVHSQLFLDFRSYKWMYCQHPVYKCLSFSHYFLRIDFRKWEYELSKAKCFSESLC